MPPSLPVPAGVAYAEANRERWVVRCPNPHCDNALALPRYHPTFTCWGPESCGVSADVVWPPNVEDIERVLMMRPARRNRNWLPGEDLLDLVRENLEHGIPVGDPDALTPGVVLQLTGDRIVYAQPAVTGRPIFRELEG